MEEPLKQVFVPVVATPGGEKTQLGVFSTEQDAWDVMRAFLTRAGSTNVVSGSIVAWELLDLRWLAFFLESFGHCHVD